MNPIIEKLWEESTKSVVPRTGDYVSASAKNIDDFTQSIIKEVLKDPRIYILFSQGKFFGDEEEKFDGWTDNPEIAQRWNHGSMHEAKRAISLNRYNKVTE